MKSYDCSETSYIFINSQELDALTESSESSKKISIKLPSLEQLWNSLLNNFVRSSEPRIYQKRTPEGKLYFKVYDPIAHQTSTFSSETEVRVWLDQRYYQ